MKITRYVQSCILIEQDSTRILIDPSGQEKDRDFGKLDAILYTHEHADHFDVDLAEKFRSSGVPIYANASTVGQMKTKTEPVQNGQEFEINQVHIQAMELPHCLMPNGSEGPQNTGYLIGGLIFHPGDGKELENLNVANLILPITGPDISMKDSFSFAKQLGASTVIPVHYDIIGANPYTYAAFAGRLGMEFEFTILKVGEQTEL